ncbi:MAG: hypothetical protein RLZZ59_283 [Pseudomonadota bacterium]
MKKILQFLFLVVIGFIITFTILAYHYFPKGVIVLQPIGGMGNQMFQYAAAYSLSKSTVGKLRVLINETSDLKGNNNPLERNHALSQFQIPQEQISYDTPVLRFIIKVLTRIKPISSILGITDIDESNFMEYQGKHDSNRFVMRSYFESEEFFVEYRDEIRKIFNIDSTKYASSLGLNKQDIESRVNVLKLSESVCVHVRLGDFAGLLSIPIDYQVKAMDLAKKIIPGVKFYVFSDDIKLAQRELGNNADIEFFNRPDSSPMEDFYLMSKCSNNINSNSTYSWWTSYLNLKDDRLIIAPYPRFSDESLVKSLDTQFVDIVLNRVNGNKKLNVWRKVINGEKNFPKNWVLIHHLESPIKISTGDLKILDLCADGSFRNGLCFK